MKLDRMLVDRHEMSRTVREEASRHSQEWGVPGGQRVRAQGALPGRRHDPADRAEGRQPAAPGHRRLEQDGANRVNVIRSASERQAAVEFAKAAALRPRIVGAALAQIADDPEVSRALFEVLETSRVLGSPDLRVTLVPPGATVLVEPGGG